MQNALQQFASRPPSQSWEPVELRSFPGVKFWSWFKPLQSPQDVLLRVPAEAWTSTAGRLTMRLVLDALGLPPNIVQFWFAGGVWVDAQQGASPYLDQPLPPWNGQDPALIVRVFPWVPALPAPVMPAAPIMANPLPALPLAAPAATVASGSASELLAAMEADWNGIIALETQLDQYRKQLGTLQGKLQSLNRDLSPDERQACDSNDIKDWNDARRWLRDSGSQVSRYIRDYTIGVSSSAGQRPRFEALYKEHVVPRKDFPGLAEAQREMEMYRKVVQGLVAKMQAVVAAGSRDGEQRAQQVLTRIAAKMRKSRHNRGS